MGIVVEAYDAPAGRLVRWVEHGVIVSPDLVSRAILDGLASGWKPNERGRDFVRRAAEFSRG